MAIPVIAGIPWLAGVIGAFFGTIYTYLIKIFTKRIAIALAFLGVMATLTTAFFAAMVGVMQGLAAAAPDELTTAAGLVVPSNAITCMTAITVAHTLRWAYEWNVKVIQYKML